MGRNKDTLVWNLFEKRNNSVYCKYCKKVFRYANVTRMRSHIANCMKCPQDVKILNVSLTKEADSCISSPSTSSAVSSVANCSVNKKDIDKLIALATTVSGFPISWVEHALWKKVFSALAPPYTLPTRKTLTTYVDNIYDEMKKSQDINLKSLSTLHLQLDGWSNVRNEGIIHFLISTPVPLLVDFVNTLDNRHTSEYLTTEIFRVMNHIGPEKFFVLIGDNANNVQRALLNVKDLYPHIITLRCTAHTLNLLADDVLKINVIKTIMKMIVDVVKEIKYSQVLSSLFTKILIEKNCNKKLKLPVKTRWSSVHDTLQVMKFVKPAMQTLAVHERVQLSSENQSHVLDERFWTMTNEVAAIVEPIAVSISQLEGNDCLIQKTVPVWNTLKLKLAEILAYTNILNEEEKQSLLDKVEYRKGTVVKPIHFAACLLDPKNCGDNLSTEEDAAAMNFIDELATYLNIENIMAEVSDFKSKSNFWSNRFVWSPVNNVTPLSWWQGICKCTKLRKVAEVIFTAPVTSAACERSFSTISGIHTKKRNRLLTERAEKMAFIAYNWNIENKNNDDLYNLNIQEDDTSPPTEDLLFVDADNVQNIDDDLFYDDIDSDLDSN